MDGVYRIGPPPEPDDYNRGALEEDGRRIYLCSLEHRLQQLEGSRNHRKPLTSKSMLRSIQQSREDHMRQFMSSGDCHGNIALRGTVYTEDKTAENSDSSKVAVSEGRTGGGGAEDQTSPQHCCEVGSPVVCPRWKSYDGEERETLVDKDECSLTWQGRGSDD